MQITSFTISSDKTQMDVTITDAAAVTALRFWDDTTYRDFSKFIDLSSKLTGAATENITITLSDLNLIEFDGVYFIEAEDPTETSLELTAELAKYRECVLSRSIQSSSCAECLTEKDLFLVNINALLKSLEYAIDLRFIEEIKILVASLDKYCTSDCLSCGASTEDTQPFQNDPDLILDGGDSES